MSKANSVFFIVIAVFHIKYASGLRCYTCGLQVEEGEKDPDLTCLNAPQNVSKITVCQPQKKYCQIYRNDDTNTGKIKSMLRTCGEKELNEDVDGGGQIARVRSCRTDLCNSGDGKTFSGGQGNGNGLITSIIVPDECSRNKATTSIQINFLFLCRILLVYCIL